MMHAAPVCHHCGAQLAPGHGGPCLACGAAQAAWIPPGALACPRCQTPAAPRPAPQRCAGCGGDFALHAGHALDASVRPPPADPWAKRIVVRAAGVVTYRMGVVEAHGVSEGMTDPITGLIPIDQSGVAYHDIYTIAVWRNVAVVTLVVAVLVPLPITLLTLWASLDAPWLLAVSAIFALFFAIMLYRAVGMRANFVRVAGRYRTITIRFDSPPFRRRSFHDELLRRAGAAPSAIP